MQSVAYLSEAATRSPGSGTSEVEAGRGALEAVLALEHQVRP